MLREEMVSRASESVWMGFEVRERVSQSFKVVSALPVAWEFEMVSGIELLS